MLEVTEERNDPDTLEALESRTQELEHFLTAPYASEHIEIPRPLETLEVLDILWAPEAADNAEI